jgi:hypothetical protein
MYRPEQVLDAEGWGFARTASALGTHAMSASEQTGLKFSVIAMPEITRT